VFGDGRIVFAKEVADMRRENLFEAVSIDFGRSFVIDARCHYPRDDIYLSLGYRKVNPKKAKAITRRVKEKFLEGATNPDAPIEIIAIYRLDNIVLVFFTSDSDYEAPIPF